MTLMQLTYFAKVAKTGHLTNAAHELHVAQPSLSQSIKKLENELQFKLFEHAGNRLILTNEGREFLNYAEIVLHSADDCLAAAERIKRKSNQYVRFAYIGLLSKHLIPSLMEDFYQQENRTVNIDYYTAGTSRIIDGLKKGDIDFGLCSLPTDVDDIIAIPVLRQPIILISSKNSPLCQLPSIQPSDLEKYAGISYLVESSMSALLEKFWTKEQITPNIRHRTTAASDTIFELVSHGFGWAMIPKTDDQQIESLARDGIVALNMPSLKLERVIYLVLYKNGKLNDTAERCWRFIFSACQNNY